MWSTFQSSFPCSTASQKWWVDSFGPSAWLVAQRRLSKPCHPPWNETIASNWHYKPLSCTIWRLTYPSDVQRARKTSHCTFLSEAGSEEVRSWMSLLPCLCKMARRFRSPSKACLWSLTGCLRIWGRAQLPTLWTWKALPDRFLPTSRQIAWYLFRLLWRWCLKAWALG